MCGLLWWIEVMNLSDGYIRFTVVKVNMGDSLIFWSDAWLLNGTVQPLLQLFGGPPHQLSKTYGTPGDPSIRLQEEDVEE